jgi:hypothetical protein
MEEIETSEVDADLIIYHSCVGCVEQQNHGRQPSPIHGFSRMI